MARSAFLGFLAFALAVGAIASDDAAVSFFEKKIRPAFVQNCYDCHSSKAKKLKAGLRVDSRAALLKGGDTGPAIVAGQPEKSLLIEALKYDNKDLQMPPDGKLEDTVIRDLETWIKSGATWPDGEAPNENPAIAKDNAADTSKAMREHWAFQPLTSPQVPVPHNPAWAETEIDRFILARLEENHLEPAPPAEKGVLLRRAYFDLIGLPPTPAELDAFQRDTAPDAFARVIDGLLARPQFGERWGRYWLDIARYAESSGGGRIRPFDNAWRYRDYVIASFNADKPYDRFLTEQLAGDLLPYDGAPQRCEQLIATGFLALGAKNLDTQDKDLLRMDVVDEQLDTLGRALMGLTLGCARCHDHKFDPIPMKEYYALAGILRSTKTVTPGSVSGWIEQPLTLDANTRLALEAYENEMADLDAKIENLKTLQRNAGDKGDKGDQGARDGGSGIDPASLPGIALDAGKAALTGEWSNSKVLKPYLGQGYVHDGNKNKGSLSASFTTALPKSGEYEVRFAYCASETRAKDVTLVVRTADGEHAVTVDETRPPPIGRLFVSVGNFRFEAEKPAEVSVSNKDTHGVLVVGGVQFIPSGTVEKAAVPVANSVAVPALPDASPSAQIKALEARMNELKKKKPTGPTAISVKDEPKVEDGPLLIRGDAHKIGPIVPRGFLTACGNSAHVSVNSSQSGRVELARWLVQPEHPLTARVLVNRIWGHLFGTGLVSSSDNFGLAGEKPTHPKLLDWLAQRFVNEGWSIKKTIRAMMLSKAYQMSATASPDALRGDPENRMLSHANRRRLEVEAIRDALLSVAGKLDLTSGGPASGKSGVSVKRSVYVTVLREEADDMFEVFDFADPNLVVGDRSRSSLSTQALFLMNSPFMIAQSKAAAERLLAREELDDGARVDLAFRLALGRLPAGRERELTLAYVQGSDTANKKSPAQRWQDVMQSLFSSLDFRFLN
jgi:hypothetical protein